MKNSTEINNKILCYHCGDECKDELIKTDDKFFCCNGCKTVYEILDENKLCNYYNFDDTPGISPKLQLNKNFDYLDDTAVVNQIIDFKDDKVSKITFSIPQMHCSSCIWLLENLYKLNEGISASQVDFLKKKLNVTFQHNKLSLKQLVVLLSTLGYEPQILLDSIEKKEENDLHKKLYYRIGIAGFAFANVMLLSFPEYLGINLQDAFLKDFFIYLSFILSLPVFFYSGWEYFGSALKGLRKKIINIDFPISVGILTLFSRSIYEVFSNTGPGYFDSLTGLIFLLLIGKLLQEKTYDALNFERSYKSFFPLSVIIKQNGNEKSIPVSKLSVGNRIVVRKNEIVPADSVLFNGAGKIDYSFVTGESKPVEKVSGEWIYAGGRQLGGAIELEVVKDVSQSYLTQLWNNDIFNDSNKTSESFFTNFSNTVSKYFTFVILLIAVTASAYWIGTSVSTALNVFTAVLIVACPCALALSVPFTLGNVMRILGRNKFFLRNSAVVEKLGKVDTVVLDKTGTLTQLGKSDVVYSGKLLNSLHQKLIKSLVRNSTHPLSRRIYKSLDVDDLFPVTGYSEIAGEGIEGIVYGYKVRAGSKKFVTDEKLLLKSTSSIKNNFEEETQKSTEVFISIDDELYGSFSIANSYRDGIEQVISSLTNNYQVYLLSGDNQSEKENLLKYFKDESKLFFNQNPGDKLLHIKRLQENGKKVLMAGDGLNDAGALKQSDVGIAVTEEIGAFSPASDAILDAAEIKFLPEFLKFSKTGIKIIFISFAISFLYNAVGLGVAVQGMLSPLFAAVLMPLSSISVVLFATLSTNYLAKRRGLLSR